MSRRTQLSWFIIRVYPRSEAVLAFTGRHLKRDCINDYLTEYLEGLEGDAKLKAWRSWHEQLRSGHFRVEQLPIVWEATR